MHASLHTRAPTTPTPTTRPARYWPGRLWYVRICDVMRAAAAVRTCPSCVCVCAITPRNITYNRLRKENFKPHAYGSVGVVATHCQECSITTSTTPMCQKHSVRAHFVRVPLNYLARTRTRTRTQTQASTNSIMKYVIIRFDWPFFRTHAKIQTIARALRRIALHYPTSVDHFSHELETHSAGLGALVLN